MSGNVIQLATEASVEKAWNDYADHAQRVLSRPELLVDRPFQEEMCRRHERFRKLFLMRDGR